MSRPLTKEISVSEMMTMRESGMSNEEIANSLDVSVMTIYRYIGKQPREITIANRQNGVATARERKADIESVDRDRIIRKKEAPIIPACLAVMARRYELHGETADYEVDMVIGSITLKLNREAAEHSTLLLKAEELEGLIAELSAIKRKVQAGNPVEVW